MAVFRIEKTRDYTVMPNCHLRDISLSLKAKGLLSLAENKNFKDLTEVRAAVAALSPEDRKLLAAMQALPFKLTTPE